MDDAQLLCLRLSLGCSGLSLGSSHSMIGINREVGGGRHAPEGHKRMPLPLGELEAPLRGMCGRCGDNLQIL